jgi:hypothetical protein
MTASAPMRMGTSMSNGKPSFSDNTGANVGLITAMGEKEGNVDGTSDGTSDVSILATEPVVASPVPPVPPPPPSGVSMCIWSPPVLADAEGASVTTNTLSLCRNVWDGVGYGVDGGMGGTGPGTTSPISGSEAITAGAIGYSVVVGIIVTGGNEGNFVVVGIIVMGGKEGSFEMLGGAVQKTLGYGV